MAHHLPSLPAEILVNIVESSPRYQKKWLYEGLRATCKELNFKLMRSYGSRFFKTVYIQLNHAAVSRLLAISKSEFAFHLETIFVFTSTFIQEQDFNPDSESSDFDSHSWYGSDLQDIYAFTRVTFDNDTLDFLLNGTCGDLLGQALTGLPNLKQFLIQQPGTWEGMRADKVYQLKAHWAMAFGTLWTVALAKAVPLEVLSMRRRGADVPADISTINTMAIFLKQLSSLKAFHLNFSLNEDEARFSQSVRVLSSVFAAAPNLINFGIGLGGAQCYDHTSSADRPKCYTFFKQMALTFPQNALRRLTLSQLTTRKKYVAMVLRSCRNTLEAFTLDSVNWASDEKCFAWFLQREMQLKEVKLRCLNECGRGILFDKISYQRPTCIESFMKSKLDQESWVGVFKSEFPQHEVVLKAEEGDDVNYWLEKVQLNCYRLGEAWNWDFQG